MPYLEVKIQSVSTDIKVSEQWTRVEHSEYKPGNRTSLTGDDLPAVLKSLHEGNVPTRVVKDENGGPQEPVVLTFVKE